MTMTEMKINHPSHLALVIAKLRRRCGTPTRVRKVIFTTAMRQKLLMEVNSSKKTTLLYFIFAKSALM